MDAVRQRSCVAASALRLPQFMKEGSVHLIAFLYCFHDSPVAVRPELLLEATCVRLKLVTVTLLYEDHNKPVYLLLWVRVSG